MQPSLFILLPVVVLILLFVAQAAKTEHDTALALKPRDVRPAPLTFAGHCHPMEKKDRLPVLLITLVYAATAFFSLGSTDAPQAFYDFGDGESVTIRIQGAPLDVWGLRSYGGLGTGGYNVEVSQDGQVWSTLWPPRTTPPTRSASPAGTGPTPRATSPATPCPRATTSCTSGWISPWTIPSTSSISGSPGGRTAACWSWGSSASWARTGSPSPLTGLWPTDPPPTRR